MDLDAFEKHCAANKMEPGLMACD